MWERNRTKTVLINILLVLFIIAIIAALVMGMQYVRRESASQDAKLSEIYVQQKQEQNAARVESVNAIQEEYEKDMRTVAQYVPGIVCWGDDTTAGSTGYLNYPYVLQTYINTYFCDIYNFASSIENASEFSRLKWDDFKVSIPVVNMGVGKESTYTILGRSGAIPYVVREDFVIPADTEPVGLLIQSETGKTVTPLIGGNAGVNNVTINGVEGVLTIDSDYYYFNGYCNYYFTRLTPGQEVSVPAGTVVKTAASDMYKDYIHVVLIGTYGEYEGAEDLVRQVKTLLSRQAQNPERFIVLGPYTDSLYTMSHYELDAIDASMMQAFGNRYISIRKYLLGNGYIDSGLTPTAEDQYYIGSSIVPPSFRVSNDSMELNSISHKLLGKLIFTRMESLGYFDEIKEELNLTETTKQILKDNPSYFDTMIKNILK